MDLLPKVYRTEGDVVDFDPSKIKQSLEKETGMNEEKSNLITELVVRRIISSGMQFLSGPHIREIVCSVLSEQHFEEERKLYTRIGMPLMDYEQILKESKNTNPEKIHYWAANQISHEYSLLRILNDAESRAHLYGDIHIHKLKFFDLRPLSQTWDPRMILKNGLPPYTNHHEVGSSDPALNLRYAVKHLVQWLGMTQGEFSGEQGYNFINTFLAPYARGLSYDDVKKEIRDLIIDINQLSFLIPQEKPITSISFSPTILEGLRKYPAIGPNGAKNGTYDDYDKECLMIFNIASEIFAKGLERGKPLRNPIHIVYFKNRWLDDFKEEYNKVWTEVRKTSFPYIVNLDSEWLENEIAKRYESKDLHNFGTLQNISCNLPRYAYISTNEDTFFETLREKMSLCFEIFRKKSKVIKERLSSGVLPICSRLTKSQYPIFSLENQNFAFNLTGLNECVKYITNEDLHESSQSLEFGERILEEMKKMCRENSEQDQKNYIIQESFSEKVLHRFAKLDMKHFPNKINLSLEEGKLRYINSTKFKSGINKDIFTKLELQGRFHKKIKNGRLLEQISLNEYLDLFQTDANFNAFLKKVGKHTNIACLKFEI
ncbi:MAG: hypothetical protein GF353_02970 [Candidatus Lokiarchaeota archaeon]|nr:hypothetical protein [Candidatus Lokiarchaeota archaeon]